MIWFVEEYLVKTLGKIDLCPGVDVTLGFGEAQLSVYIFWHSPGLNTGWYPILQIDFKGRTIRHREGPENPDGWRAFMDDAADFVARYDFS